MTVVGAGDDRATFAERVSLQLRARYPGSQVELDPARYSLRVRAPGVDVTLPLAALQSACDREPHRSATLIADFTRSVERRLVPQAEEPLALGRVLWCVRSTRYLAGVGRSDELLTEPIGGDIVAFVAESLPGSVMRGVARAEWEAAAIDAAAVRAAATANTESRFLRLLTRVAAISRVPADGWRLSGDALYQGSILMTPSLLRALVERAGDDVLIGVPDRGLALVIPASAPGVERFPSRVVQEWREAMNPCSRDVVRSDGRGLRIVERSRRPTPLMPWLSE
jgi:hypothetical protein